MFDAFLVLLSQRQKHGIELFFLRIRHDGTTKRSFKIKLNENQSENKKRTDVSTEIDRKEMNENIKRSDIFFFLKRPTIRDSELFRNVETEWIRRSGWNKTWYRSTIQT